MSYWMKWGIQNCWSRRKQSHLCPPRCFTLFQFSLGNFNAGDLSIQVEQVGEWWVSSVWVGWEKIAKISNKWENVAQFMQQAIKSHLMMKCSLLLDVPFTSFSFLLHSLSISSHLVPFFYDLRSIWCPIIKSSNRTDDSLRVWIEKK